MNISTFHIEDFLADESFCRYCLGNNPHDVQKWKDLLNQYPEQKKNADEAKKILFLLNGGITDQDYQKDHSNFTSSFRKHQLKKEDAVSLRPSLKRTIPIRTLITASIVVLALVVTVIIPRRDTTPTGSNCTALTSGRAEKSTYTLPDGSIVKLNSNTTIILSEDFNRKERNISLKGEAFFQVAHNADKPFIVHTKRQDIKVLGTIFNVKEYPEDQTSETSLVQGSIEITTHSPRQSTITPQHLVLKPKEKFVITDEKSKVKSLTTNPLTKSIIETDWTSNRLTFNDDNFETIAKQLERWYKVDIRFNNPDVMHYRFVGTFERESITQVLNVLQSTNSFQYRKEGDKIIIY